TVCVVGKMRDLILQLSKSSIYSTKPHLASVLEHRSSEGHPVIVSNSDTSLIRSLYRNFTHHYIKAKRSIGVSAGESKSATEIIAVSGVRCWVGFDPSRGVDSSAVYEVRV
ncbi:DNA adenine methylase, partial [Escherichia coli]|nr:DNA adenine methylase [Escherichia coli]MDM9346295.1 DNA adenine methylase [Escherichia coli]